LFRRTLRCRTHRDDSRPASASTVNLFQAALVHPVSSPLKSIRHRLSSEPPTGVQDDGSLPADDSNNYILESSGIIFPDRVFNLYKPSLRKVLPHHCNLLQFVGDLLPGGGAGSSSRDFVVIGFFLRA
jgi:hypothetical protein